MTRAGCSGRRLLKLCRVSVAVCDILRLGQSCNGLYSLSFCYFFSFQTLSAFSIFPFNNISFSKYPEAGLLILVSFLLDILRLGWSCNGLFFSFLSLFFLLSESVGLFNFFLSIILAFQSTLRLAC